MSQSTTIYAEPGEGSDVSVYRREGRSYVCFMCCAAGAVKLFSCNTPAEMVNHLTKQHRGDKVPHECLQELLREVELAVFGEVSG